MNFNLIRPTNFMFLIKSIGKNKKNQSISFNLYTKLLQLLFPSFCFRYRMIWNATRGKYWIMPDI